MKETEKSKDPIYKLGGIGNKFVFAILGTVMAGLALTIIPASYLYGFSIDSVLGMTFLGLLSYFCLSRVFTKEYTFAIYPQRLVIDSKSFAWGEITEIIVSESKKAINVELVKENNKKISQSLLAVLFGLVTIRASIRTTPKTRRELGGLLATTETGIMFNRKSEFKQALEVIVYYANLNKIPIIDLDKE